MAPNKKNIDTLIIEIDNAVANHDDIRFNEALKLLRKKLPINWAQIIAKKVNKSKFLVYKVMNNQVKDVDENIIPAAIALANSEKSRKKNIISKIKNL